MKFKYSYRPAGGHANALLKCNDYSFFTRKW